MYYVVGQFFVRYQNAKNKSLQFLFVPLSLKSQLGRYQFTPLFLTKKIHNYYLDLTRKLDTRYSYIGGNSYRDKKYIREPQDKIPTSIGQDI